MSETQDEQEVEQTDTGATPEPENPQVAKEEQGLTDEAVGDPPDSSPRDEGSEA